MKGTEVTEGQIKHADEFLRLVEPQHGSHVSVERKQIVRLLAWYAAIRVKSGKAEPGVLVTRSVDTPSAGEPKP